jgi:PPK2 family polyphosphate:nucleotide phosphotransferase
MPDTHRLEPGCTVRLADLTTRGKQFESSRDAAAEEFLSLREELVELQTRLYAEGRRKLLVVLQATDTGGKDGTIRHVFRGVNPQGVRVTSFKAPTDRELAHDFLWRVHKAVPPAGMIGIFNRSHYEDVLAVRVLNLVPEPVWRPRYEQINEFEKLLTDTGTTILKFFLHISSATQMKRLRQRLNDPNKHWKFSLEDLEKRKMWDAYAAAYEEMLNRCTTSQAPWHVIPADQKWYRNLAVARVVVDSLRQLNPQYPKAKDNLEGVVVS